MGPPRGAYSRAHRRRGGQGHTPSTSPSDRGSALHLRSRREAGRAAALRGTARADEGLARRGCRSRRTYRATDRAGEVLFDASRVASEVARVVSRVAAPGSVAGRRGHAADVEHAAHAGDEGVEERGEALHEAPPFPAHVQRSGGAAPRRPPQVEQNPSERSRGGGGAGRGGGVGGGATGAGSLARATAMKRVASAEMETMLRALTRRSRAGARTRAHSCRRSR